MSLNNKYLNILVGILFFGLTPKLAMSQYLQDKARDCMQRGFSLTRTNQPADRKETFYSMLSLQDGKCEWTPTRHIVTRAWVMVSINWIFEPGETQKLLVVDGKETLLKDGDVVYCKVDITKNVPPYRPCPKNMIPPEDQSEGLPSPSSPRKDRDSHA